MIKGRAWGSGFRAGFKGVGLGFASDLGFMGKGLGFRDYGRRDVGPLHRGMSGLNGDAEAYHNVTQRSRK